MWFFCPSDDKMLHPSRSVLISNSRWTKKTLDGCGMTRLTPTWWSCLCRTWWSAALPAGCRPTSARAPDCAPAWSLRRTQSWCVGGCGAFSSGVCCCGLPTQYTQLQPRQSTFHHLPLHRSPGSSVQLSGNKVGSTQSCFRFSEQAKKKKNHL